jgi:hypothetical protein
MSTVNTQAESSYEKQANEFAKKHGVKLTIGTPDYKKHFAGDKEERYVFPCKLSRKGASYSLNFGQSLAEQDNEPTMYDILTCLQKYDVGSFDDFCSEYGYYPINSSEDYNRAQKTYKAVVREYKGVQRLFADIMDELQEIQ